MLRIILFLVVIAAAAAGAGWLAEQPGNVVLSWRGWQAEMTLAVAALALLSAIVAVALGWTILAGVLRSPGRLRRSRRARREARARRAITQGLLAVGHGDAAIARAHANAAKRHAPQDPLALLLQAQSAQLDGDRDGAKRAFLAMAGRDDTKSLGMRGLFIEAQRAEDPYAALTIAEEALRLSPASSWASQAVLGFRCARGDWSGALEILETNLTSGLIDKKTYRRLRGVLLTARAIECEETDVSLSRDSALEAVKLAPTLVPAAVLASKYLSEAHQIRRAMKTIETAWLAHPHPDLAEAYAHIKPGDSAQVRLQRVEALAAKASGDTEGAVAVARAAIDAGDFNRARGALMPFVDAPTQRVAMLMAEIEHTERKDSRSARAWTLRAVRALRDPVWTADGCVSDRWRPVSPVTGRLDAFQWTTPLAELPTNKAVVLESDLFDETLIESPTEEVTEGVTSEPATPEVSKAEPSKPETSGTPVEVVMESKPAAEAPVVGPTESSPPLFHRPQRSAAAPVIPIVRAPDDPGIDEDEAATGDFDDKANPAASQAGNWRGYRPRRDN
ncbi:heme biosynthesis protein HemY [Rhodopseudomonas palustris]|uniref:HemY-like n=1 Tax=Rhodopseudomonas palustris (strain BisB18) TaxID=316056 RepID=Q21DA8_RHOPB